ncbi:hypothetical protein TNIN_358501 [Trichonephila inaurata madagascariensis]|uniref:Uncharacterized protein n=1 Tax=Trichonephila inaurata madagascariensis TaxID=2747483 RepID=A0A8X6XLJ4_9ARAC|nr:hypothetical protein TNIN_358501 [Trichonephila inaurata madagascariensis]
MVDVLFDDIDEDWDTYLSIEPAWNKPSFFFSSDVIPKRRETKKKKNTSAGGPALAVRNWVRKNKCTEGRCVKIIQAHLKENRVVITRELGDRSNFGDGHTFTDGQVDHHVSQVLVDMGRFQRSIKRETCAIAKSSYGVA